MRRLLFSWLGLGCGLVLLLILNRAVLFQGEQFAFRDVAHYYAPLDQRVAQEWGAGRWPLWDPWLNGGQPLLGSPMAAVFYPGKLLYAVFSASWASRLYIIAHTALACLGMYRLARSLEISPTGASLAGLTYGFGAPIFILYSNPIFLVGAAWLPFGLRAVDGIMRLGQARAPFELAAVLTLQVLGGDPQAAYLTVLSALGYMVLLAWRERSRPGLARGQGWILVSALALFWIVATVAGAWSRRHIGGWLGPIWVPAALAWAAALGWRFWPRPAGAGVERPASTSVENRGPRRLIPLMGAAGLALLLSAVQILPTVEFTASSNRAGEGAALTFTKFSTEPWRLVECLWPTVFGQPLPENRGWIQAIPPHNDRQLWQHSLYVGGLALVLGLGGIAKLRNNEPPWRAWLMTIVVVSLGAGFGRFAGPLWWLRTIPGAGSLLGPHDPLYSMPRIDGFVDDGYGSIYSLLVAVFPGFGFFRYPSKLLTFTAAAWAVLAGVGWDEAMTRRDRRLLRRCAIALALSVGALVLALLFSQQAVAALTGRIPGDALSGPANPRGAWAETQRSLAHGTVVLAVVLALAWWGPRRPRLAGTLALLLVTADLAAANARLVWTAPRAIFDALPEVAARIAEAERTDPATGPFRIHRLALWHPEHFLAESSPDRISELTAWERGTLQGLYGLPLGLERTVNAGSLELDDHLLNFHPRLVPVQGEAAKALGVPPGRPILVAPRRSFDLWGTRYFIVPVKQSGWDTEARGYASFVPNTELIAPNPATLAKLPGGRAGWAKRQDWQLLRNKTAYPRAWIVHHARIVPPATDPDARQQLVDEIAYAKDVFWSEPGRRVADPQTMAWIEIDDRKALQGALSRTNPDATESVTVTRDEPLRVELNAQLNSPGLVILAATHYPGWRLTIDGQPTPILRANRTMRGAAVAAGKHSLVFVYDPWSFRIGLAVSGLGLGLFLTLIAARSVRTLILGPGKGTPGPEPSAPTVGGEPRREHLQRG